MGDNSDQTVVEPLRTIHPKWNTGLIVASLAISFLGAFTSTQLMCQAKTSRYSSGVIAWTSLGSLIFGFCSIWSLHFVATLACELDLQIGLNVPRIILSAFLAVGFTFLALGSDLIRRSCRKARRRRRYISKRAPSPSASRHNSESESLLRPSMNGDARSNPDFPTRRQFDYFKPDTPKRLRLIRRSSSGLGPLINSTDNAETSPMPSTTSDMEAAAAHANHPRLAVAMQQAAEEDFNSDDESTVRRSSENSLVERSSSFTSSSATTGQWSMGKFLSTRTRRQIRSSQNNVFVATLQALSQGLTIRNLTEGFVWSMAITGMHYVGIFALEIPGGYITLKAWSVALSVSVGFVVCIAGCILFGGMETNLAQQVLFSAVAAGGIAAKHFTAMAGTSFHTVMPPTLNRGYPPGLATAIAAVAVFTCIVANGLLAHSATLSRDKLAEMFYTRKKMWQAIAQRQAAESAAQAKSDFIASASHEIRTPLHQLQGYSDLLSRTELTEEGRILMYAIQHATKTLSLITTNVLDWSRLEKHGNETACHPVTLDIRQVCEAVINLLPNKDEESEAEMLVVVAPDVPQSLVLDETYIHRVTMNLLSNATKFTTEGYIMLQVEIKDGKLVMTVRDTGCGIPPSFLPQIFDPFTQAETLGAHRGTGLGLSITKQLMKKMGGDIVVSSKYAATVGNQLSGTDFTATIPIPELIETNTTTTFSIPRVAVFQNGNDRYLEGIRRAWARYGTEVAMIRDKSEIGNIKYVWIEISLLRNEPHTYSWLAHQQHLLVLIPYDTQLSIDCVFGAASVPAHFITLRKPLVWHSIINTIACVEAGTKCVPEKSVRFAPETLLVDNTSTKSPHTILLVEDNKINIRLMQKMLAALSYSVLIAKDGQEAIDQTVAHDEEIDVILMDQSMPVKDGLTATREIRALERNGTLARKHTIIAITAVVSAESQDLAEDAGTDDFLAKPVSLVNLGACLGKWVEG